ncbi:MAG: glycoside hydrolase family 2 TIM barrel-domain containing protein [Promethearchaeota archaeon]
MREIKILEEDWLFHLGDEKEAFKEDFEEDEWEEVEIPHDWGIFGPFKKMRTENWWLFQNLDYRIGYLPQGIGWYRKYIYIPKEYENKEVIIQFDGVYRDSDVWINGHHLGHRMYGYITFYYDLTPYLKFGTENVIAVRVDNKGVSSRWYSGSGIYRKVQLLIMDKIHISQWGTFVKTLNINQISDDHNSAESALIELDIKIENECSKDKSSGRKGDNKRETDNLNGGSHLEGDYQVISRIYAKQIIIDAKGEEANNHNNNNHNNNNHNDNNDNGHFLVEATTNLDIIGRHSTQIIQTFELKNPRLWSPDRPNLYEIETRIIKDNREVIDVYRTPLGIRTFRFDADNGFFLNGRNLKFKGVCLHHDNGPLGAKIYRRAIERKLEILKNMGCNAIRTSHNPPSNEMLELCDEMGFMVMDEAFDEWTLLKTPLGYSRVFDQDYERDVRDFVNRDKNHPSVIIWSCGNEVPEQKYKSGIEVLKKLLDVFHREDPTRPVTQGCNMIDEANKTGFADLLDVVGYNYKGDHIVEYNSDPNPPDKSFICRYDIEHQKYPNRKMIGSENCSALNTRGVYHFPVVYTRNAKKNAKSGDFHLSSYDVTSEVPLIILKTRPYVSGMFTWEGFDYIGEPTPYYWPARSSQFGLVDLCGFPKDNYYLYKSQWTKEPMVHILPHWNWNNEYFNLKDPIPVWIYSNCDSVELFLNGKSLGEKSFKDEDFMDVLHLEWLVNYEPGELKAIGKINGKEMCSKIIRTSDVPAVIKLRADRTTIKANKDLVYITASIHDKNGIFVPTAEELLTFTIEGDGEIIGVGNGNPISHEPFVDEQRHTFNGLALVIVRSLKKKGTLIIKATNPHLKSAEIKIQME